MAVKQIKIDEVKITNPCPRCGEQMLVIDGKLTRWMTCPACKFKKLDQKPKEGIKIVSLK